MRRFALNRDEDKTGISGTGYVADGVQFRNMKCVMCWRSANSSIAVYDSIEVLTRIHGHDGKTTVEWIDPEVREYSNSINPMHRLA
jgi:hypothetical protein